MEAQQLSLYCVGHRVLQTRTHPISEQELLSQEIVDLGQRLHNYIEIHENSFALSAVQVGVPKRLFVLKVPAAFEVVNERQSSSQNQTENPSAPLRLTVANPVLEPRNPDPQGGDVRRSHWCTETCLSAPGAQAAVKRHESVSMLFFDVDLGQERALHFTGFLAFLVQHMVDHLDGILFTQRMNPSSFTLTPTLFSSFQTAHTLSSPQASLDVFQGPQEYIFAPLAAPPTHGQSGPQHPPETHHSGDARREGQSEEERVGVETGQHGSKPVSMWQVISPTSLHLNM